MKRIKGYIGIFLITISALILRLIFIDKQDGLWNDEYISWMISSTPFNGGFIEGVKSQCHMPFYYLYLKFFMTLFGQNDIVLRLTSVFAGILSVIAMYFIGKEKDDKTGLLCAGFTALSSFLIYYSQEVRFYSILFFFSSLALLFTLRAVKKPCVKNFILCAIFNFFIIFTHTIGFVFVFFNLIFLSANLYKHYKKIIIIIWSCVTAGGLTVLPLIIKIFLTQSFSQWWGSFSLSRIGYLFTDYFSPVLTNLTNAPDFLRTDPIFVICAIIPTLIAFIFLIRSLKNKINIWLLFVAAGTVLVLSIASITGKLVFITKYSIEIYPILILLVCSGITDMDNKKLKNTLVAIYCLITALYLIFYPTSAFKIRRAEGHKIMTDILERMEPKDGDIILLEYYPQQRFEKYFDFSKYKVVSIHKGNFAEYLTADTNYSQAYKNGKLLYKNMLSGEPNIYFKNKLHKELLENLRPNQSVIMITLDSVSFHAPEKVKAIVADKIAYNKEPLLFLLFSYIKEETFSELAENLPITRLEKKGNWTVIKFTKLKN